MFVSDRCTRIEPPRHAPTLAWIAASLVVAILAVAVVARTLGNAAPTYGSEAARYVRAL